MPDRIRVSTDEEFPIQVFFNAVSDDSFVEMVEHLSAGVGFSFNDADCSFPSDLDPDEEPFDGVRFSLYEDSIVIDLARLRYFLGLACESHAARIPADGPRLKECLSRLENAKP